MTTTLGTTATPKAAEKVIKHIDVNLEPCYSEDCAERSNTAGKSDTKKS